MSARVITEAPNERGARDNQQPKSRAQHRRCRKTCIMRPRMTPLVPIRTSSFGKELPQASGQVLGGARVAYEAVTWQGHHIWSPLAPEFFSRCTRTTPSSKRTLCLHTRYVWGHTYCFTSLVPGSYRKSTAGAPVPRFAVESQVRSACN